MFISTGIQRSGWGYIFKVSVSLALMSYILNCLPIKDMYREINGIFFPLNVLVFYLQSFLQGQCVIVKYENMVNRM